MKIYSVYDRKFKPYGKILEGYDTEALLEVMRSIPQPETGTDYAPAIDVLEVLPVFETFRDRAFGGMPVELGMCWGHNRRLNCLEYHRDSEVNIGTDDFILLLAKVDEIEDGKLDTGKVKAFQVPAGVVVEVYATTLHYAPCHVDPEAGFRTAVVLPRGTNTDYELTTHKSPEDALLRARNKWLLAHPDSPEAKDGAYIGLTGINIDLDQ